MKKKFVLLLAGVLAYTNVPAQFSMRNGGGLVGGFGREYILFGEPNGVHNLFQIDKFAFAPGLFLFPQYHFGVEKPKSRSVYSSGKSGSNSRSNSNSRSRSNSRSSSNRKPFDFSVGAPINLTLNFVVVNGQNISTLLYSVAPTYNINFGSMRYATQNRAGFFAGAGFGITNTNQVGGNEQEVTGLISPSSVRYKKLASGSDYKLRGLGIGPVLHFGGELFNPFSRFQGSKLGLRLGYQPAINRGGVNYYSLNIITNAGFINR